MAGGLAVRGAMAAVVAPVKKHGGSRCRRDVRSEDDEQRIA
jgi:hypothetical protein